MRVLTPSKNDPRQPPELDKHAFEIVKALAGGNRPLERKARMTRRFGVSAAPRRAKRRGREALSTLCFQGTFHMRGSIGR